MQLRLRPGVFDRQHDLAPGAAPGHLPELGYGGDGVTVGEHTRRPKRLCQKPRAAAAQSVGVGRDREAEPLAVTHQVCSAARTSMWLTATRRSRVTM